MSHSSIKALIEPIHRVHGLFNPFEMKTYLVFIFITAFVGFRAGYELSVILEIVAASYLPSWERTGTVPMWIIENISLTLFAGFMFLIVLHISALFEFLLLGLIKGEEPVIDVAWDNYGGAVQITLFRLLMVLASVPPLYLLIWMSSTDPMIPIVLIIGVVVVSLSVFNGVVTDLGVPVMMMDEVNVFTAIQEVKKVALENKSMFLLYILFRSILTSIIILGAGIASLITASILSSPGGIVDFMASNADIETGILAGYSEITLGIVVVLITIAIMLLTIVLMVQLPIKLYMRIYPLVVLAEMDDRYIFFDE